MYNTFKSKSSCNNNMSKPEETLEKADHNDPKLKRAPLLGSARLTLFVIFMICTSNFILQRFNINFAIVCMHAPTPKVLLEDNYQAEFLNGTTTSILGNISTGEAKLESSSLILNDLNNLLHSSVENASTWVTSERLDFDLHNPSSAYKCGSGIKRRNKGNHTDGNFSSEFSWSKETKGAIIAAFYYGLTFSQIPGGWFVDRFGAKLSLILSQAFLSVLSLLSPIAAKIGPEYMFVCRLLQGVANGAAMPAIIVLSTRWCGSMERTFLMGIGSAGFGLAAAFVYPITAFFCENMGWEWSFYFYGGSGLLWCVAALPLMYEWPETHPRIGMTELQFIQKHRAVQYGGPKRQAIRPPWKAMLLSVPVWAFIVCNFCMFWCFLTVSAYMPTYFTEVLDLNISENGILSAMPYIAMLSVHFIVAIVLDKLRERKCCSITVLRKTFNSIGMFASAVSLALLGLVSCDNDYPVLWAVLLLTSCQLFLEFPLTAGYMFSIFEIAPKYASSLTSLSNTFGLLAGFVGPVAVAYITPDGTRDQWVIIFYLSSGLMALGGLVYLIFGKCTLLDWAADGAQGNTVVDGNALSRNNSKKAEQELKLLKIQLINGESDVKGQMIK